MTPSRLFAALLSLFLFAFAISSCVVRFANSEQGLSENYRRVYLPAAIDNTSRGGVAARVAFAIRKQLSLRTEITLVPIEEARLALDIEIRNHTRASTSQADCEELLKEDPNARVASEAFSCKDDLSFGRAQVSAEGETITLDVLARAVDLNNGSVFFARSFLVSRSFPVVHDEIAERKRLAEAKLPQYHALRYLENADDTALSLGYTIADKIVLTILTLDPSETK